MLSKRFNIGNMDFISSGLYQYRDVEGNFRNVVKKAGIMDIF